MRKTVTYFLAAAVIAGAIFLYQGFDRERGPHLGERSAPGEGRTKINREGDLEAIVTFLSEEQDAPPDRLLFKVKISSSRWNLTAYDPAETASLLNAREEKISTGFTWEGEVVEEEHLEGLLNVPNKRMDGEPFWEKGIDSLTLVLRDLGGVKERKFHWIF